MAFERIKIESVSSEIGETSSPLDNERIVDNSYEDRTKDSFQINQQYQLDSETTKGKISTGAVIPSDMTVKLIRADSANWEIFITAFMNLMLTLFGIFLGAWISDSNNPNPKFSFLEKLSTLFFLLFSLILIIIWIVIKVKQSKKGVRIPHEFLNNFEEKSKRGTN